MVDEPPNSGGERQLRRFIWRRPCTRLRPRPYLIDPLVTRDPAKIRNENVLMTVMAIVAVYESHQPRRLNHGIGPRSVSFAIS